MKHPTTSRWNVTKTSQWDVSTTSFWNVVTTSQKDITTTSYQYVSMTSQKSIKWNTQRRLSGTLQRRLSGTYPRRPSRSQMFLKVVVRKSYAIFTGKRLRWSPFLIKFQSFRPATLLKRNSNKSVFLWILQNLRTVFFIEHIRWLLLSFATTFRNCCWKDRLITVNKYHVHSTPEKHLKKVFGMLQVVNKEMQYLLLTFGIFQVVF